jgi:hypothetical protein
MNTPPVDTLHKAKLAASDTAELFHEGYYIPPQRARAMLAEHIATLRTDKPCCPRGAYARYLCAAAYRWLLEWSTVDPYSD